MAVEKVMEVKGVMLTILPPLPLLPPLRPLLTSIHQFKVNRSVARLELATHSYRMRR
jgi:hypothetical protein